MHFPAAQAAMLDQTAEIGHKRTVEYANGGSRNDAAKSNHTSQENRQ